MSYYPPPVGTPQTSYPYASYQPQTPGAPSVYAHLQASGTTPYTAYSQPGAPGANAYAPPPWPYQYYTPPQQQQPRPAPPPAPVTQKPTFSAYQRETPAATSSAAAGGATASNATATTGTAPAATRGPRAKQSVKGLFTKDLRSIMYGFGDDRNPSNDSVNVMEEILVEYLVDVCQTPRKGRLSIDDIRRALSRPADAKKLARMEELLFLQEDIKRARAQFDEKEGVGQQMEP